MRASFIRVSLEDLSHHYAAISYCWGDPTPCERIWCSQFEYLDITASAMSVLSNVAAMVKPSWLWLDQVCIDQNNIREKGSQVQLMTEIFHSASAVIAWVGEPSTDSSLAMGLIKCLAETIQDLKRLDQSISPESLRHSPSCQYPSPSWKALGDLLRRPWFQRVWVVQENAVASQALLYHSGKRIDWSCLASVVQTLWELELGTWLQDKRTLEHPRGFGSVLEINRIRDFRQQGGCDDLPTVLRQTLYFDSTDPRDKVFAILGITRDGLNWRFRPDYQTPVEDIYTQSVVRMLRTQQVLKTRRILNFLHLAGIGWPRNIDSLPSWVPDWSRGTQRRFIFMTTSGLTFLAAGKSTPKVQVDAKTRELTLEGILVGTVDAVSAPFPFMDTTKAVLHWLDETIQLCGGHQQSPQGEAYWRTLIANMTCKGRKATPEYGKWFEKFLADYNSRVESHCDHNGCRCSTETATPEGRLYWPSVFLEERIFFTTNCGYVGLAPQGSVRGDVIAIFSGATTPFILRARQPPHGKDKTYALIGESYIHQLMNGEGLEMGTLQDIVLH